MLHTEQGRSAIDAVQDDCCEGMPALLLHGAAAWELHADDSTTLLNDRYSNLQR